VIELAENVRFGKELLGRHRRAKGVDGGELDGNEIAGLWIDGFPDFRVAASADGL
jgi:hypothetical protein